MTDVAYKSWYFIPVDVTPADAAEEGRVITAQPPMMVMMAIDAGGSLAFHVPTDGTPLQLTVTTTGLSAEGRGADAIEVYVGDRVEESMTREAVSWERGQDVMNALFHGTLSRPKKIIKLHIPTSPALVITNVEFSTP
jgi:hypothetical protein